MQDKILSMIGMATKAGKTVSGEFTVEKAVKEKKAVLVIVADDASANTKKMFTDKCTFYNIPIYYYSNKDELGKMTGKQMRATVAVLDKGFAQAIEKQFGILKINENSGGC